MKMNEFNFIFLPIFLFTVFHKWILHVKNLFLIYFIIFLFFILLFKNVLLLCFTHDICFHWKTYSSQCHLCPEHFCFQGFIYDLKHFLSPKKNILFLFCFFKGKKSPRNVFFSWNFFITSLFSLFVLWNENVFSSWKKKISWLLFHLVLTRDTRVSTAAAADSSFTPQDAAGKQVSSAESTCWQNPGQPHPNVSN